MPVALASLHPFFSQQLAAGWPIAIIITVIIMIPVSSVTIVAIITIKMMTPIEIITMLGGRGWAGCWVGLGRANMKKPNFYLCSY